VIDLMAALRASVEQGQATRVGRGRYEGGEGPSQEGGRKEGSGQEGGRQGAREEGGRQDRTGEEGAREEGSGQKGRGAAFCLTGHACGAAPVPHCWPSSPTCRFLTSIRSGRPGPAGPSRSPEHPSSSGTPPARRRTGNRRCTSTAWRAPPPTGRTWPRCSRRGWTGPRSTCPGSAAPARLRVVTTR
jgi:hypothetical protein